MPLPLPLRPLHLGDVGGIFNLATEGLGKYTAKASGLFMMMVVGGGVMPYVQDWIGRTAG